MINLDRDPNTAPDVTTLKGLRDRAILAVLIGCGLRRSEAATLTFFHVAQREGHWAAVDLVGKGNRTRTVPMPSWTKVTIDEWTEATSITEGRIFRSVHKGGYVNGNNLGEVNGHGFASCGKRLPAAWDAPETGAASVLHRELPYPRIARRKAHKIPTPPKPGAPDVSSLAGPRATHAGRSPP